MQVEIFTGPGCAHCANAKAMLDRAGHVYIERDIAEAEGMAEFRARLPRIKALPQIFVDGEHIGNHEDLRLFLTAQR